MRSVTRRCSTSTSLTYSASLTLTRGGNSCAPYFFELLQQRCSPEKMLPEILPSLSRISGAATD